MDVKICDRCERIIGDEGGVYIEIKNIDDKSVYDTFDLCKACESDLYKWLESGKE